MALKRAFSSKDWFLAISIVLSLFTPLIGGHWWWSLVVVVVIIMFAIGHVLRRTPQWID
jgi:hypothetical protein